MIDKRTTDAVRMEVQALAERHGMCLVFMTYAIDHPDGSTGVQSLDMSKVGAIPTTLTREINDSISKWLETLEWERE